MSAVPRTRSSTLTSELIRIDTTNTGELDTTTGEAEAAAYVAAKLAEVGYETEVVESGRRGGTTCSAGSPGADPEPRPRCWCTGTSTSCPPTPSEWTVHPFSGAVRDGYVWGRGAVDMKDMDAMILALARQFSATGTVPPRDLVFAFLADEEAGGAYGAHWLVEHRPDLFEGCTEAIGEVGGFSLTLGEDLRVYPVRPAEKGIAWMRLRVRRQPGPRLVGARRQRRDDPVRGRRPPRPPPVPARAHRADARVPRRGHRADRHRVPPTGRSPRRRGGQARRRRPDGRRDHPQHRQPDDAPGRLQGQRHPVARPRPPSTAGSCPAGRRRSSASSTSCSARTSSASGSRNLPAVETTFDGALVDAMIAAVKAEDDGAHTLPFMMCGGTDAKAFAQPRACAASGSPRCGCPPDLDFASLFHGIDERVPVDALTLRHPGARPVPDGRADGSARERSRW